MLYRTGNSSLISVHKEYRLASSELYVYPPTLLWNSLPIFMKFGMVFAQGGLIFQDV